MESKKIVLMNLFTEKKERCKCREQTHGHRLGEERLGQTEKVALPYIYYQV